jgi:hypothetical protein
VLHYCLQFHAFIDENGLDVLDNVFFSDEAWFHLSDSINNQYHNMWSYEYLHVFHELPLDCK